jgi:predicted DCC family thiol-disulfide oxidoreductase YuxK
VSSETRADQALPVDPARHPIVLFDGVCNLCNGTVRFLIERDPRARLRFASLQSGFGRALQERHGLDPDALDTFVVVDGEGVHLRSDAILRLLAGLPAPWRGLAWLRLLPRPLRDALYGVVVRNRYRWFGRRDECLLPTPELRARFLG